MALDQYAPCPCGSGKKFKWCCLPIHVEIDKAYRQDADGQHEAALRTMDEVVAAHPTNPEALGRKAQLLYQNEKVDDAEKVLDQAFAINPNYPFGHLLRGSFRQAEGELPGALLLYRKAAELYDTEARDSLSSLYSLITECELKLHRPVAARAALKMAMHLQPANGELRQAFGAESTVPQTACKEYAFRSPPASAPPERRAAWDKTLASPNRLGQAVQAFEQLTQADPEDGAAWYNLGLVRAWLGDNRAAIEALDQALRREADDARAAEMEALAQVLRQGWGLEDVSDYVETSYLLQIRDPQRLVQVLQDWNQDHRLIIMPSAPEEEQAGIINGLVLDRQASLVTGSAAPAFVRLGAFLFIFRDQMRLWHTNRDALQRVREAFRKDADLALTEVRQDQRPATFADVLSSALILPVNVTDQAEAERGIREQVQGYFEETWLHQPLKSLQGAPPVDAAGHPQLRKKLGGIVQFLQDCASLGGRPSSYDFDRLRRKLGLLGDGAAPASTAGGADVSGMGAAELAGLAVDSQSPEQLEQAFQAAQKLDARELATRFAQALVSRPPQPDRPDRFAVYAYLIQQAQAAGNLDAALDLVNEGEKADCEQNEGRRRNDYELRRAQLHVKRGETDQAGDVFERLIERVPDELRYRGTAAEAMLGARQGARALRFAESGLAQARAKNNRDSEQYFLELVAAAKKMG
jgi:tetratricopeptide (TPR) repeat protein